MEWIEFIGPPGVGKSFLFNKLLKSRTKEDSWITPEEAADLIFIRDQYWKSMTKVNLVKLFIREKILRRKMSISSKFPVKTKIKLIDFFGEDLEVHAELLFHGLHEKSEFGYRKKLNMMSWFYTHRLEPFILLHGSKLDAPILFEDGIIHNNTGFKNFESYMNFKSKDIKNIPLPDSIVLILASPNTIFNRIKYRNTLGDGRFMQRDLSDSEIKYHVDRSLKSSLKIANTLEKLGCSLLQINADDPVKDSCDKINNFLRKRY